MVLSKGYQFENLLILGSGVPVAICGLTGMVKFARDAVKAFVCDQVLEWNIGLTIPNKVCIPV